MGRLRLRGATRKGLIATVGNRACAHEQLSYRDLFARVDELAAGFLELGIGKGDHVGLIAENCDLWLLSDLALLSLGAIDVPRGGHASAAEVSFCMTHARCRVVIVENAAQVEKLGESRTACDHILVMKGDAPDGTLPLDDIFKRGQARLAREPDCVTTATAAVSPGDLATIIYTSGTTGNPKGVMLTHANILHNILALPEILNFEERQRFLSFLPSWHSFGRAVEYIVLDQGLELHYGNKWTLKDDLKRVQPHFFCGVPRVWESFHDAIIGGIERKSAAVRKLMLSLLAASRAFVAARRRLGGFRLGNEGMVVKPGPFGRTSATLSLCALALPHLLADRLIYSRLRAALGGHVGAAVSGGGPLPTHVDEFLTRAGVPLLNGYGLTESSPVICVRRRNRPILGTIGHPVAMTEVRIVDDDGNDVGRTRRGVIQARGPQIMQGYFENPDATRGALPGDGWLNTGDVGMLTSAGDVMITGRAKDTIVLRGGENVEPEPIETELCSSPHVAEALIVGHAQKTLGVLVVPDADTVRSALQLGEDIDEATLASLPAVETLLRTEVARIVSRQRGYQNFERIGKLRVLSEPFSIDDGTLTATLKKRRHVIEKKHAQAINALFSAEA